MGLFRDFAMNRRRRRAARQERNRRAAHPSMYEAVICPVCGEPDCDEHCAWCLGGPTDHLMDCPVELNLYPVDDAASGLMCADCEQTFEVGDHYMIGSMFGIRVMWCIGCGANEEVLDQ